ncbi:multiple epidermal growth factor-like domains protein 10 [Physella acuta]|uniref:multiple epidermal growth factor-like domains protein 10 n=1 Tax=Physella acuta TaxID=109671 RepID=UPI0027DBE5F0|nr:multiple epidermal growth factor-like domains protein 10 [Physella acuta]
MAHEGKLLPALCPDYTHSLSAVDKCRLCQHQCIFNKLNNSVSCLCHDGFKVDPIDELKCSECENGTFGNNCSQNCSCVTPNTEYCNKVNGSCVCKQGWTGDRCQTDVDECGGKLIDCPEHSNCINTNGSYDCDCIDGYKKTIINKTQCIECENGTFGHNCSQNCNCFTSNTAYCNKVNGSCVCKQGWTGDTCQLDINECTVNNICQFKDNCSNFAGGYNCSCPMGFYLLLDGHTCHECEHFKYGRDCEETCSCIRPYSLGCNPVDGACDCVAGRQGDNCADDINECENSSLCMQELNFDCVNTIGSYRCICKPGFYLKNIFQQEVCKECLENFYGENCTKACTCASNAVCDKADGSCFCGAGWRGENCDVDVDECSEGLRQCDASKHLICVNTKGNSTCECQSGYAWFPESNDCIVPYFPFGAESNDNLLNFSNSNKLLSNENVFVSQPISLSSGVAFGNSYPITAQILTSGAIVFDDGNEQVTGTPDLKFAFLQRDKIIAPYWSDIDPNSGQVFYHLYERCGSSVFMGKPDATPSQLVSSVMRRAETDIAKFHHFSGFTANVVLVATWVSVSPLSDANVTDKEHNNTFQAVFVSGWKTDTLYEQSLAETSYVIYIYQKPKMKWRYVRGRIIQIGFTNGQELKALPNTNSRVVTLLGNYKWNTDYEGVVSYETGSVSSPAQSCHRYICDNVGLLQDPVYQKDKKALY